MTFTREPWQIGPTAADHAERLARAAERYDTGRTVHNALRRGRPPWWRPFARLTWRRADLIVHRALMTRTHAANSHPGPALPVTWPDDLYPTGDRP